MKYQSPFEYLPDEHMRLVGIIAAHWEMFTVILQRAVAECLTLKPEDVRLLLENISTNALFDIIGSHAGMLPENDKKTINKSLVRMRGAYALRNKFVHAKWTSNEGDPGNPTPFSIRTRGGRLKIHLAPANKTELEAAAEEIIAAAQNFTETLQGYGILQSLKDDTN